MAREYIISVDIGASKIKVQPIDRDGNQGKEVLAILVGQDLNNNNFVKMLADGIREGISSVTDGKIIAIGIGGPGPLDSEVGIIFNTPNLSWLKNLKLTEELKKEIPDYPIYLLNDADAAGLGEHWLGTGKDNRDVIVLTLGSGVGSAVIANAQLQRGQGQAAEWGHTLLSVQNELRECHCGHFNCAEAYLGTQGIVTLYTQEFNVTVGNLSEEEKYNLSFKMRQGIKENNPKWVNIQNRYAEHLSIFLRNIILVHQPEIIILGGGVAFGNQSLLDKTRGQLKTLMDPTKDTMSIMADKVKIELAKFENAVNLGAAKYVIEKLS